MFIPRRSKVLFEGDLSACQARIVAHLAGDQNALDLMDKKDFKRNKFGLKDDIHVWTAMLVTDAVFEAVDEEVRQLGKKTRHAGNFGMGKRRLSMMAQISEWRAGRCLEKFHEANPKISSVFWVDVQQALQDNNMVLTSCTGGKRLFFDKWGEEMFKAAYAHLPQVIESDHVKAAGIRIEERAPWIEFILEAHDSLLAEIDSTDKAIQDAARVFKEEFETPIDFIKCSLPRGPLVIPCECSFSAKNWKEMEKVKIN
jgi:DNA polymerase I-like protein with 3'-5' exonuclease and polymerase domains